MTLFRGHGRVVRREQALSLLRPLCALWPVLLVLSAIAPSIVYLALLTAGVTWAALALVDVDRGPVLLQADETGLRAAGRWVARAVEIDGTLLLRPTSRDQPFRVVLEHTGGRRTEVQMASLVHARALVDALGRAGRRATFVLRAAPTAASRAAFAGLVGAASLSTWLVLPVSGAMPTLLVVAPMAAFAVLVCTGAAFSAFQPSLRLTLGDDGLSVDTGTRQRFVSFAEVAGARALVRGREARVDVMLRSGEVLAAVVERDAGSSADAAGDAESRATAIARSIADAAARWRCGPMAPVLPGLGRRGRAAASWLASLARVGSGADADHRRAAVPPESLWRILEDGASAPDARAGAAAALAASLDEPGRARLRLAATATADLRLASVFEAAAGGDEAEVAGALGRIDDEKQEARGSCFS
jgi:hypothetical protein